MIFPVVDIFIPWVELKWSWLNFVVTWLKIFKPNHSTKKLSQMVLSQVTGNLCCPVNTRFYRKVFWPAGNTTFTREHLQHLNSAMLRASVLDKLAHFIWTHPLQSVQYTQSINPECFRHFRAMQVSLFFINIKSRNLTNCRNTTFGCVPISQKNITVKQSVCETKPWIDKMKYERNYLTGLW